jgi:hypothetical protein
MTAVGEEITIGGGSGDGVNPRRSAEEVRIVAGMRREIRDYEAGFMDADDAVRLFQELVDAGVVWHMSERYQRTAQALLDAGMIFPPRGEAALEEEEDAFEDPAVWLASGS